MARSFQVVVECSFSVIVRVLDKVLSSELAGVHCPYMHFAWSIYVEDDLCINYLSLWYQCKNKR